MQWRGTAPTTRCVVISFESVAARDDVRSGRVPGSAVAVDHGWQHVSATEDDAAGRHGSGAGAHDADHDAGHDAAVFLHLSVWTRALLDREQHPWDRAPVLGPKSSPDGFLVSRGLVQGLCVPFLGAERTTTNIPRRIHLRSDPAFPPARPVIPNAAQPAELRKRDRYVRSAPGAQ